MRFPTLEEMRVAVRDWCWCVYPGLQCEDAQEDDRTSAYRQSLDRYIALETACALQETNRLLRLIADRLEADRLKAVIASSKDS